MLSIFGSLSFNGFSRCVAVTVLMYNYSGKWKPEQGIAAARDEHTLSLPVAGDRINFARRVLG